MSIFITTSAKTLDFKPNWNSNIISKPLFLEKTKVIVNQIQKNSIKELSKLMSVSEEIADLNYYRYKHWQFEHNKLSSKPAMIAYKGDIFKQFDAKQFDDSQREYLHKHLVISSGLYGILRAYDLIQPYRLEMAAKVKIQKFKNLYEFWKEDVNSYLQRALKDHKSQFIINIASDEYFNVVDRTQFKDKIIDVGFIHIKNGIEKNIGILNKKARGVVIRYIVENKVEGPEELMKFDYDGYKLRSFDGNRMIFVRVIS